MLWKVIAFDADYRRYKVKFAPEQAKKAQRKTIGITLLFL
jgi:hypothetical protein